MPTVGSQDPLEGCVIPEQSIKTLSSYYGADKSETGLGHCRQMLGDTDFAK